MKLANCPVTLRAHVGHMALSTMTDEATRILETAVETYRVSRSSGNQDNLEKLRHLIAEHCREHLQFDPSPVPISAAPNQGKSPIPLVLPTYNRLQTGHPGAKFCASGLARFSGQGVLTLAD
jgi:hypothetical protein